VIRRLLAVADARGQQMLRRAVVLTVLTAVLQGCAFLVLIPFLTALLSGEVADARIWLLVLLGIGVVYAVASWFGSRAGQTATELVLGSLLDRFGERLVSLPLAYFAKDRSGEAADFVTNGAVFTASAPHSILRPLLTSLITPATVLVGTWFIDWRVALTMTCLVPVLLLGQRMLAARMRASDRTQVVWTAEASARVVEFARVQPALRAAPDSAIAHDLVSVALHGQHDSGRRLNLVGGLGSGVVSLFVQLTVAAVMVVSTWLALGGELSAAALIPLLVLAVRFVEPLVVASSLSGGIGMAENTLDRLQQLAEEPVPPEPATPRVPAHTGITFDRVGFGYTDDEPPVLSDLSFEAPANSFTAIVGPSGSGKTTITRLMARFYDPQTGTVSLGGVPLPELGTDQMMRRVAPVFQDVYLFDGSILDNVWLGDPDASREDVLDAARRARLDEVAARLAQGWDTRVGEGGSNLSGGERQRVSIARALLKDADVVLLDEATAALDVTNEQAVQEAITEGRRRCTVVAVAHRLHTIAHADHIVMLTADGRVAEQGTHESMLAADGPYARYWRERAAATQWQVSAERPVP